MSGVERVLEIAASTRVLRERRLRALDAAPGRALLGREFLHLRGLAERCAAETGVAFRVSLGATALARIVALCAQRSAFFGPLVADRPGFAAALAGTLRDLRDAGVPPERLPSEVAPLRSLYTEVEQALVRLADTGHVDRIGLFRLAVRGASSFVARRGFTFAEVHGATELVGSAGDLVDAIAAALPAGALRFFQPDWANDHAERLRTEWPWRFEPEAVELVADPALARDGEIPEGALRVLRSRTPREELERVAREVLALLERGVAPREILIVARSLERYASWLPPIFDGYGIPVTSSLTRPTVAAPEGRAWLDVVRALGRDLERAPVLRILDAVCERDVARLAERIARKGAVVRGEDDWRAALEAAESSREHSDLRRALERFFAARRDFAAARGFGEASRVALALARELPGDECRAALEAVAALDEVDRAARASRSPEAADLAGALESALLELKTSWRAQDEGGVRILDAIQARGLPCSQLFLLGMVHGAWPRDLREDPFLPDPVRETLRANLRRPVPIRGWAIDEERFLLGLLLAQARAHVTISYAYADGTGRALAPSGLLRDLPFAARGTDVVPTDSTPDRDGRDFERAPDFIGTEAASILAAGRRHLRATEATRAEDLPFDGSVGPEALRLPDSLSPSFVDQLGRCPLRAFYSTVLRAKELEEPAPDALEATEAGTLVHEVLSQLYRDLFAAKGLDEGGQREHTLERARSLLPNAIASAARGVRSRVRTRRPAVWQAVLAQVSRAIDDLLRRDLALLLPTGVVELEVERPIAATIDLGESTQLRIAGKVDRLLTVPDGTLRVGDYKTSRDFAKPVSESRIKRGTSLQIPLYALAVAAERESQAVIGEALPVPLRPERDRDDGRDKERALPLEEIREYAFPVLRELAGLLARAEFPFRHDEAECRFCPYTIACRHEQPESRERLRSAPGLSGWHALRGDGS